jgi:hypothetical protein
MKFINPYKLENIGKLVYNPKYQTVENVVSTTCRCISTDFGDYELDGLRFAVLTSTARCYYMHDLITGNMSRIFPKHEIL